MNQATLYFLGLTAIFVTCASETYGRAHNLREVFGPTTASPEVLEGKQEKAAVHFKECRELKKSGIAAECFDYEIAVGCAGTGVRGCSVTQMFGSRGCTVDKDSCADEFAMSHASNWTPWTNASISAVCCNRNAVTVE